MHDITFDFEWMDIGGPPRPEREATGARLRIMVGDEPVTRLVYQNGEGKKTTHESVFLPLYDLAEWIAFRWWRLLYEPMVEGRTNGEDYPYRHTLTYATDSHALPRLELVPEGDVVRLTWTPEAHPASHLTFTSEGEAYVRRDALEKQMARMLNAVNRRLVEEGVYGTKFQEEWAAIQEARDDDGMREFCADVARLGLDPYALDPQIETTILEIDDFIPVSLRDAFYGAAHPERIREQARALRAASGLFSGEARGSEFLTSIRRTTSARTFEHDRPWKEGYAFATYVRKEMSLHDVIFESTDEIARRFFLNPSESIHFGHQSRGLFNVYVEAISQDVPGFVLDTPESEPSKKFHFCRGLHEYLSTSNGQALLVTQEKTWRQRRNRAFAAEFLAPIDRLRAKVSEHAKRERIIDDEELGRLSRAFGVGDDLVKHQLENHRVIERTSVYASQ
jgi:hypothetical protein